MNLVGELIVDWKEKRYLSQIEDTRVAQLFKPKPDTPAEYALRMEKTIFILKKQNKLGNGMWGKIDYLCKHCGYRIRFVDEL